MPLYEFECENCGRFELLLPHGPFLNFARCANCNGNAPLVPSLCTMRPDPNWHFGEMIKGKEIQSRSKILRAKKENHTVTLSGQRDVDDMHRAAEAARREKDQKLERETRRHFTETLSNTGVLDSFGEVRREALKDQGNGDIKGTFTVEELAK